MQSKKTMTVLKKTVKTDENVGKTFMSKDRARSFGLNPMVKMTLAKVSLENGVTYYEFEEVKGTKWPASLFYLVG